MPNYSGVWTLQQQLQAKAQGLWPINGPFSYIEDVFSTYLYTGNASTQTITNGIDLADKGGLVLLKSRSSAIGNRFFDTTRGATQALTSTSTLAQFVESTSVTSFNSNGFTMGSESAINGSGTTFVSWAFREQPKFFDIVTYTGDGTNNRQIAHNLGSAPGCVIVKGVSTASNWPVWHRAYNSGATDYNGYLNLTNVFGLERDFSSDGSGQMTSTTFCVNGVSNSNISGQTFVAYLFAHNAGGFGPTATDNVISCGTYTGTGAAGNAITLGYEPQWFMTKPVSTAGYSWPINDIMRGWGAAGVDAFLFANTTTAEDTSNSNLVQPTATGIQFDANYVGNLSGVTYVYIAIRRGPMKVPTLGTSVFSVDTSTTQSDLTSTLTFPDLGLFKDRTTVANWFVSDRLRGFTSAYYTPTIYTNLTNAEATPTTGDTITANGYNNVIYAGGAGVAGNYPLLYSFRRAPGFFDEVCYTGNSVARTISHNLAAVPELWILKSRDGPTEWPVGSTSISNAEYVVLNTTAAKANGATYWNSTYPTSSVFSVGTSNNVNNSGVNYVSYLFATVAGVSKVGSYTGTGALQTVACGFTTGARFVLIKRTDSTGDWYVWDSTRGLSSGTDPYLLLNSTAAEVTGTNYVDTDTTGFKVTAAAPAALNANGGNYIFLAIA